MRTLIMCRFDFVSKSSEITGIGNGKPKIYSSISSYKVIQPKMDQNFIHNLLTTATHSHNYGENRIYFIYWHYKE
jgi:hypothetical protein